MRAVLVLTISALFVPTAFAEENDNRLVDAQRHLIAAFYSDVVRGTERRLRDSGLAESHIAAIAESAVVGYVSCYLDGFETFSEQERDAAIVKLADGANVFSVLENLAQEVAMVEHGSMATTAETKAVLRRFWARVSPCIGAVRQRLGVPPR